MLYVCDYAREPHFEVRECNASHMTKISVQEKIVEFTRSKTRVIQ